jgi:putative inorganic carbon (HCO3(-)) transporter
LKFPSFLQESYKSHPDYLIKFGLIVFAVFSPFSIAGSQTGFSIALLGWALKFIFNKKPFWVKSYLDKPVLIYLGAIFIAALFTPNRIQSVISIKDEWLYLLFFLLVNNVEDERFAKKSIDIIIVISALVAFYAIYQHYTGNDFYHAKILDPIDGSGKFRSVGNFSIPLTYGFYTMVVSLLSFSLAFSGEDKTKRIFYFVCSFLCVTGNLFSGTRGTLIAQIFGFVVFFIFSPNRDRKQGIPMVLFYFILIFLIDPDIFVRMQPLTQAEVASMDIRTVIWSTSFRIFLDHPIAGIGFGSFNQFYELYLKVPSQIFGHAHNDLLNVAVNAGIIGLIPFVWLWITIWRNLKKKFEECFVYDQTKEKYTKSMSKAGLVVVSAYLVASLFQCYYFDAIDFMILFFVLGQVEVSDKIRMNAYAFGGARRAKFCLDFRKLIVKLATKRGRKQW